MEKLFTYTYGEHIAKELRERLQEERVQRNKTEDDPSGVDQLDGALKDCYSADPAIKGKTKN